MSMWLTLARAAAVANVGLLIALGSVWGRNYRRHGATHTLSLLAFAAFLLLENLLWLFLYFVHGGFVAWYVHSGTDIQAAVMVLSGLELAALLSMTYITWR
ncbi:MAG: hypothetical protein ABEI98_05895 [Halorhabdus sp.]